MALKVTGNLLLLNKTQVANPLISIIPHLMFAGKLSVDAHVYVKESESENAQQVSGIGYQDIQMEGALKEKHDAFLAELQLYIKNDLEAKNPDCTIEEVSSVDFKAVEEEENND
jgi:hypothetical protein